MVLAQGLSFGFKSDGGWSWESMELGQLEYEWVSHSLHIVSAPFHGG